MNHTIQLTAEQFEALQSGQSITIEPPKPAITKWKPVGGSYNVDVVSLKHYEKPSKEGYKLAGVEYQTKDQADLASKALRAYARQLAWLAENDDGWVADWNNSQQSKYFVYIENYSNKVIVCGNFIAKSFGTIYMSHANATKLAQLMNDGIVEF